jgi:endonuclease-3
VNEAKRREIFSRLRAANPAPRTELLYHSPFELLIAVILSAQATDKGVNKATPALFRAAGTPANMLALGVAGLTPYIRTIGLFNSKAKNIIATCAALVTRHAGRVPHSREALEALPGVGRKTANVVLNTAFGQPTIAVDTHIFRVANRTGLAPGKTARAVEDKLMKVVPPEYLLHAHHWLILHGRYVCKARAPACPQCAIADLCEYRRKTKPPADPDGRRGVPRYASRKRKSRSAAAASSGQSSGVKCPPGSSTNGARSNCASGRATVSTGRTVSRSPHRTSAGTPLPRSASPRRSV